MSHSEYLKYLGKDMRYLAIKQSRLKKYISHHVHPENIDLDELVYIFTPKKEDELLKTNFVVSVLEDRIYTRQLERTLKEFHNTVTKIFTIYYKELNSIYKRKSKTNLIKFRRRLLESNIAPVKKRALYRLLIKFQIELGILRTIKDYKSKAIKYNEF